MLSEALGFGCMGCFRWENQDLRVGYRLVYVEGSGDELLGVLIDGLSASFNSHWA